MTKIQDFVETYNCFSNTGESISLYEFVKRFDDNYIEFLMDYYRIPRLDLSNILKYIGYSVDEYGNEKVELELYGVNNSFHGEKNQLLSLYKNGGYSASVSNIKVDETVPSFREFIAISEDTVDKFVEFGKKYSQFIETYYQIKNNLIFNEYGCRLHSTLSNTKDKNNSDYIQDIDCLTLSLEMDRPNGVDTSEFDFYLRDYFGYVIAHKCVFDREYTQLDVDRINYIINNLRIDIDKLPSLFRQQKRTRKKEVK